MLSIFGRCAGICIYEWVSTLRPFRIQWRNKPQPRNFCQIFFDDSRLGTLVDPGRGNNPARSLSDLAAQGLLGTNIRPHRDLLVTVIQRMRAVSLLDGRWGLDVPKHRVIAHPHTLHLHGLTTQEAKNQGLNSCARLPRAAPWNELGHLFRNRDTTVRHPSCRDSGIHFDLRVSHHTPRVTPSKSQGERCPSWKRII